MRPQHPNTRLPYNPPLPRDVRLSRSDLDTDVVTIHGSDDDGWIRVSISIPGVAQAATPTAKAADSYDRVVF